MSDSVTIQNSDGDTFAEVIDIIGVSEIKKAFHKSIGEGSLHKWFKGSKSKDGKPGWVNVVTGGTCASDKPGEGTPKCVSASKRASMTKAERLSAARRKKKADPGQQAKTGAAKPTYVSTDSPRKKKMKEEYFNWREEIKRDEYGDPIGGPKISKKQKAKNLASNTPDEQHNSRVGESVEYFDLPLEVEIPHTDATFKLGLMFRESLDVNKGMLFIFEEVGQHSFHMKNTRIPLDIAFVREDGIVESIKELNPYSSLPVYSDGEVLFAIEANRGWFTENNVEVGDEIVLGEAKDKKGKGSGTKDACYHKVKSRYSVWPSAYASGALVKCRKVGAANWGNKSESVEMKNYLDKKAKMLTKKRDAQSDAAKNNPHFDSTQPSPSGRNKYEEVQIDEKKAQKCWPGYEKKGTKMMFGKRYNNCVKKEEFSNWRDELDYEGKDDSKKLHENPLKPGGALNPDDGIIDIVTGRSNKKNLEKQKKPGGIRPLDRSALVQMSGPNRKDYRNKRDELVKQKQLKLDKASMSEAKSPAWQRKEGKSESGGLNKKGVASYRAANPGSKLKTAVTTKPSKLKKGSKAAKRRLSFCKRMKGMKKKLTSAKTARDPDSRINKSLRKWNC